MVKAAVIGASSESVHSIREAQKLGIKVIALDGNPKAEGLFAADKGLHVNISDEQAVLEALKEEGISFVLTVPIGRYLSTIGAVNDAFGLRGIGRKAAVLCTDKFAFHCALEKEGLRDCRCYLVPGTEKFPTAAQKKTAEELPAEAAAPEKLWKTGQPLSFPAILKPRYGSGSRSIFFLEKASMLEDALAEIVPDREDYVLEEAVSGTEYGVDAALEGEQFRLILLRKKLLTRPPARQAVGYLAADPRKEAQLWQAVERYLQKITATLGLKDCLMHADLMVQKRQNGYHIFAIELSARPSGHNLHNLFTPLATGIDMAREYIRYQTGQPYRFVPDQVKTMLIRYFDFEDCVITKVPDQKALVLPEDLCLAAWQCNIVPGQKMEKVTTGHSVMGRGYFVLEGKDEAALIEGAEKILEQFEQKALA